MGCSSVTVLHIDKWFCPAQQGSGFLLAIFTKVCFFPALHSRVYPEWFNYNFPCVRQIKEESRSVVPSTLFISLTDCSSPNPRAAAAVAAQSPSKCMYKWGRESSANSTQVCRPVEITECLACLKTNKNTLSFFWYIFIDNTPESLEEKFLNH